MLSREDGEVNLVLPKRNALVLHAKNIKKMKIPVLSLRTIK